MLHWFWRGGPEGVAVTRSVFSDPHLIIGEDRVVEGEQRVHAIGYVTRVLLVVDTARKEGLRLYYPDHFSPSGRRSRKGSCLKESE
jgi:hypothetical protein